MFDNFRYVDGLKGKITKRKESPKEIKEDLNTNEISKKFRLDNGNMIKSTFCELPFVAPAPAKYRERYASICDICFENNLICNHFKELPLALLIIGHNPSEHAWKSGFFYSNPTNRMWKLLTGSSGGNGIIPDSYSVQDQNRLPDLTRVGFTDLGLFPGSDASSFKKIAMQNCVKSFYDRILAHCTRAAAAPKIIAFAGKRQYQCLWGTKSLRLIYGEQKLRPPSWPQALENTKVWLLPSSSGRSVMTNVDRCTPYQQLAVQVEMARQQLSMVYEKTEDK